MPAPDRALGRRPPRQWAVLLLSACALVPAGAHAIDTVDAIQVSGVRPGPRLWHVERDGAHLWILGTVTPLPVGVTWRSAEVETLLSRTDVVLAAKPLEITMPRAAWIMLTQRSLVMNRGGRRLRDLLPADLYARFAALRRATLGDSDKWEHDRPLIAGMLLEDAALKAGGLSNRLDVSLTVRRLAREHHVRIREVSIPDGPDLLRALQTVPPEAENRCLDAMLHTVEDGIPALRERALAWSSGDVERIRGLPEPASAFCADLLTAEPRAGAPLAQIRGRWLEALETQLGQRGTALAVVDLDLLLGGGGLLESLRAGGIDIDGP